MFPFLLLLGIGAFLAVQAAKGTVAQALGPQAVQPGLRGWVPLAAAETIFPNPQSAQNAHIVGKTVIFQMYVPSSSFPVQANFYGRVIADDSDVVLLRYAIQYGGRSQNLTEKAGAVPGPIPGTLIRGVPFQSIVEVYGAGAIGPVAPGPAAPTPVPARLSCTGGVISDPKLAAEYALYASDPVKYSHLACDLVYRLSGEDGCDALAAAIEESIVATGTDCKTVV